MAVAVSVRFARSAAAFASSFALPGGWNAANGECFTQQSVSTAWDPTLDEVEELIDGLAEAGKGVAQKASECDCTVSLTC